MTRSETQRYCPHDLQARISLSGSNVSPVQIVPHGTSSMMKAQDLLNLANQKLLQITENNHSPTSIQN